MDESWRMRMGIPTAKAAANQNLPRRRSTEDISHRQSSESPLLDPEDFSDVFGGPPRTVISRQFADTDCFPRSSSTSFYEEIFKPNENLGSFPVPPRTGRSLPEFRIPAEKGGRRSDRFEGFYSDIFGWNDEEVKRTRTRTRSRSKSKTSSSSVLSSEDFSPLPPMAGGSGGDHLGDGDVSVFASKLRPLNVPKRWNSNVSMHEEYLSHQDMPSFSSTNPSYNMEFDYNESSRSFHFRRNPSPETTGLELHSFSSIRVPADDLELMNSPSSVVSSVCQEQEQDQAAADKSSQCHMFQDQGIEQEEDESMSSYVIEINADNREVTDEAIGVDEAIAWAKEKFQSHCSVDMMPSSDHFSDGQKDDESTHVQLDNEPDNSPNEEEKRQLEIQMATEMMDEKIRLWSSGKEADIRLLLSTLHHILWPDSGWIPVPLTNLIESSHVKKAYQKARLFLHPDKLQQRGAIFPQKYVADKAFHILQDAWAAFVSPDVFCN